MFHPHAVLGDGIVILSAAHRCKSAFRRWSGGSDFTRIAGRRVFDKLGYIVITEDESLAMPKMIRCHRRFVPQASLRGFGASFLGFEAQDFIQISLMNFS